MPPEGKGAVGAAGPRAPQAWQAYVDSRLASLESASLLRRLYPTIPTQSPMEVMIRADVLDSWLQANGSPAARPAAALPPDPAALSRLRLFSLNDYLGLSSHPEVRAAGAHAALDSGMGPRSSALVGGYTAAHAELEAALASLKAAPAALLFPTGYAANLAAVTALAGDAGAAIFSDALNHASMIDGMRLAARSGPSVHVYRHNDLGHLEQLLAACPPARRRLVITDSLFSMDGDCADLAGLAALRARHGFLLAVDEAHATLVCGPHGGGVAEAAGVADQVDLHIGTLSKAFGAHGGFIACSAPLRDLLMNRGRSYVYSTALPGPTVAAAHAALRVAQQEPQRREHLWRLVDRLGGALGSPAASPIVPLVLGGEAAALDAARGLLAAGFHVPAIRPPTVPRGTARLRISLSAAHSEADVDDLVAALRQCGICRDSPAGGPSLQLPAAWDPGAIVAKL